MRRDPIRTLLDAVRDHGEIVHLRMLHRHVVVLIDPDHVRHVFQDNAANYSKQTPGFRVLRTFLADGLLTNDGERDENGLIFDVNIFRALNTYQFTDRLLFRTITEFNTYDQTLGLNFLFTYRVNAGTAFYIGYDDHYRQREQFDDQVNITDSGYVQTNRAVFTKFQYLFRY